MSLVPLITMSAAKKKPQTRGPPELMEAQAIDLFDQMIAEYQKEEFQTLLHKLFDAAGDDLLEQARARQQACFPYQVAVITKFGFEGTRKGVMMSVQAFQKFNHLPKVQWQAAVCSWLVNPALQRVQPRPDIPSDKSDEHSDGCEAKSVCLTHLDPARPLIYGGMMDELRAPSAFVLAPSTEGQVKLMEYVRDDPAGPFAGELDAWPGCDEEIQGRWAKWGFEQEPDEPLLKADWHSVEEWGASATIFVPRKATSVLVRRAPPRLVAFLEAFREVNWSCWREIVETLESSAAQARENGDDQRQKLLQQACRIFRGRGFFAAVEAQVWWGRKTTKTRSHKDGVTSLLHLAVTLGGVRSVRVGGFQAPTSVFPYPHSYDTESFRRSKKYPNQSKELLPTPDDLLKENNVWDDSSWRVDDLKSVDMDRGTVYLSSPFIFEHGVSYESCSKKNAVVALQCRFAFRKEEEAQSVNMLRDSHMLAVASIIANRIRTETDMEHLRMPTLAEVKRVERRIAERNAMIVGGQLQSCKPLFSKISDAKKESIN